MAVKQQQTYVVCFENSVTVKHKILHYPLIRVVLKEKSHNCSLGRQVFTELGEIVQIKLRLEESNFLQ